MPSEAGVRPTQQRRNIYTVLEDLDFHWGLDEVSEFDEMWNFGIPIDYIASNFGRDVIEVALLAMDRRMKGFIEPRKGGVFGRDEMGDEELGTT